MRDTLVFFSQMVEMVDIKFTPPSPLQHPQIATGKKDPLTDGVRHLVARHCCPFLFLLQCAKQKVVFVAVVNFIAHLRALCVWEVNYNVTKLKNAILLVCCGKRP